MTNLVLACAATVCLWSSSASGQQPPDTTALWLLRPVAAEWPVPVYKDPGLGQLLGFMMPGAGQIYAGKSVQGSVLWLAAVGGVAGAFMCNRGRDRYGDPVRGCQSQMQVGIGVAVVSWMYGFFTAHDDVAEYNQRLREDVRNGAYGPVR